MNPADPRCRTWNAIDVIAVKGHLPVSGDLGKEIFQIQLPHNVLQEKVTGINGGRLGSFPVCLFDSLIKITGKFNLQPSGSVLGIHLVDFGLNICNRIICDFQ